MPLAPEGCSGLPANKVPRELHGEVCIIAVLGVSLLVAAALVLAFLEQPVPALHWISAALLCWTFVLWQCHQRLHLNRSGGHTPLYTTLGYGNRITLLRGWFIAGTAGFVAIAQVEIHLKLLYVPAVLYTLAALGDWFDGHLARRLQHTTLLGKELDTALDALGLLVAPLVAVLYGKLHGSYLLVSMAYYLFQWGIYWRHRQGKVVYALPPSRLRRHLAGLQMAVVAAALWPPLPAGVMQWLGIALMMPLLLGFCRDWLHVSGRLDAPREHAS